MCKTCALEAANVYGYIFACKATYCIYIQHVRSKWLMRTSTSLCVKPLLLHALYLLFDVAMTVVLMLDDSSGVTMTDVMDARWFVQRCNDHRDCVIVLIDCPGGSVRRMQYSWLFSTIILRSDWTVLVVRSSGFRRDLLSTYFVMERPILTLDRFLDDEQQLTQWSNVTVHYDLVWCSIKYVQWYWGYFWYKCDISD